jgi:UDP-N-acetylmuramate dehydrogenase
VGDADGVAVYDDYGHNPTEIAATLTAARERTERHLIAVYQPHVYERTRQLHRELGEALGLADAAVVTEITGARDAPRDGVTGRLVVRALPEAVRAGWAPTYDDAVTVTSAWARPGDLVVTFGVGEPWKLARAIVERLERGIALSRWTTIGTGGAAVAFARPATDEELADALAWARAEALRIVVVGLGSNVLVADGGVDALVLHLEGDLATATVRDDALVAGGGATNAVCLHRARSAGLGGFEFACAIPGTAGGGVRMNAGAYGSDWAAILRRALIVDAEGATWRTPVELGLSYRHSRLTAGEVVARVEYDLEPRPVDEIKATVKELVDRRKASQPTTKRTFGSVWKNPPGDAGAGRMLELCGLKGHRVGGALISPMHANFIENAGDATTADCLALMAESRRRAREQFGVELEHEVVLLGDIALPVV